MLNWVTARYFIQELIKRPHFLITMRKLIMGLGFIFGLLTILVLMNTHVMTANAQIEFNLENKVLTSNESRLLILNSAIYKSYGSQSHIFGEILNNFTHPISFVKVYAAVYDTVGNIVATDYSYARDDYLKPGQKSGFWILIQKDVPEGSKYTLSATFEDTLTKPESLKLEINLMSLNPAKVIGTVTNLGKEPATNVDVSAIFYDENHKVVDSEENFVNIGYGLSPQGKGTFTLEPILNYENRDKIKIVALNAESTEYSMLSNNLTKSGLP